MISWLQGWKRENRTFPWQCSALKNWTQGLTTDLRVCTYKYFCVTILLLWTQWLYSDSLAAAVTAANTLVLVSYSVSGRIPKAWHNSGCKGPQEASGQTSQAKHGQLQQLAQGLSSQVLKNSKAEGPTASLGTCSSVWLLLRWKQFSSLVATCVCCLLSHRCAALQSLAPPFLHLAIT